MLCLFPEICQMFIKAFAGVLLGQIPCLYAPFGANTARRRGLHIVRDDVFSKSTSSLTHSVAPSFQIEPAALGFDLVSVLICKCFLL